MWLVVSSWVVGYSMTSERTATNNQQPATITYQPSTTP
ncbi:SPW repeat protein [Hymenobacter sp. BT186]|uniref:SPW repeat protein n=1 Tax=Hymenobacter telluris TaxID=2816474 RepID=A0A939EV24_9BACT|nr:SPW repeat protein [Hymenobacter telluris]MBW3373226.1 SPW repeat protein [Hymenobacter norwichensis]